MRAAEPGRVHPAKDEVDQMICWLTGYDAGGLEQVIAAEVDMGTSFAQTPQLNPNASLTTGLICSDRVEKIEDTRMQQIRYLDEVARGKKMSSILRGGAEPAARSTRGVAGHRARPPWP
ncbi:MAG: DUF2200 domain-containing protein [Actinobacteria bacterium]|nr:DUF2200 domain-containing protein [Actinomycetota bacterium]MCG2803425.1 DUF2200 domain-containing protein [Cellulomonas sp.]